jgi:hypothetical protein
MSFIPRKVLHKRTYRLRRMIMQTIIKKTIAPPISTRGLLNRLVMIPVVVVLVVVVVVPGPVVGG